jgi:PhnB protein
VAHAEIEIGDSVVIVEDADPVRGTQAPPTGGLAGTPVFQFVYVADVDAARAIQTPSGSTVSTANDLADVLCAPGGI